VSRGASGFRGVGTYSFWGIALALWDQGPAGAVTDSTVPEVERGRRWGDGPVAMTAELTNCWSLECATSP
jgi:hypothetical protein